MRRYVRWVIRYRLLVISLALLVTGILAAQVRHLRVIVDTKDILPQKHPYVAATKQIERTFGLKNVVVIGITPKEGDAFQPHVLTKVQRITAALSDLPDVRKETVLSLSAPRAKSITGTAEGLEVRPLMETVPQTADEIEALRRTIRANPVYLNAIVSQDERTAAILAESRDPPGGYRPMIEKIRALVDRERDASVDIAVGGERLFTAQVEQFSERMVFLFPLAVLITGLIHYEAFRTVQGLILPLVTALLAVVWALGFMGLAGVPLDTFNVGTPILILAVAAGHAVQILKRYYEEYHRLSRSTHLAPAEANQAAVVESVAQIGPVLLTAGGVAALGFLSLIVFEIATIWTFGVFTALGIVSALILEMSFIPAFRSLLSPPGDREGRRERERRVWDRITEMLARRVTGPHRWQIYLATACLVLVWVKGSSRVIVDNSAKSFFSKDLQVQRENRALNDHLAGTNSLYLLVEGRTEGVIQDPRVLHAMEATQRFLDQQPNVGKTVSLVDFVKRMNGAMHGDDSAYNRIPESRNLIAQYLLLYSMSGGEGDLDTYVDAAYQSATILAFLKINNTAYLDELMAKLHAFLPAQFGDDVQIKVGGAVPEWAALNQVIVHGKVLNVVQIGGVILLMSSMVFRSLVAGLLVLVPLMLAVLANFGLMGWTGIPLNIATATISAMVVGIGADYAIYFIYRLREEVARGADETTAVRTALTTAGKAILFVASAIAGGYSVLLFSWGFYIHMWFAILMATAMVVSSTAALTVLPSLILTFRPRFVFGDARRHLYRARAKISALLVLALGRSVSLAVRLGVRQRPRRVFRRAP